MEEYVETAFDAFIACRFHSGLTCCRTIFEVGVRLLWCATDKSGTECRPAQVYKKLLQEDYKLCKHVAAVFKSKDGGTDWNEAAHEAKEQMDQLLVHASVPGMETMIGAIEEESQGKLAFRSLYPFVYRVLCGSAHGTLPLFKQFDRRGSTVVLKTERKMPGYTVHVALTAVMYLVAPPYHYFEWTAEWENIIAQYVEALPPEARPK